jgi:hypothetical protein
MSKQIGARSRIKKLAWIAASLGGAALLSLQPAVASTVTYTDSLQSGNMCTGCGPFGTVAVSTVSGHTDEVSVTLTLTSGEVFANTGAGSALLFEISGNPTLTVSGLTTGFSFSQSSSPMHADGSGNWHNAIVCDVCGSGTSPPQNSGPVSFLLSVASGTLTPMSFVTNGNGYLFASDIGVPQSGGGFSTGDVVTSGPLTTVPLPASSWFLLSALAGFGAFTRRRLAA